MNSVRFQVHLAEESIIHYANGIKAPLQRIDGALIAPSTMPITFWKRTDAPWLDMPEPLLHGTQHFHYKAPLTAGMELDCLLALTKIEQKPGRRGNLVLYTHSLTCACAGRSIMTAETVLISVGDK
ncbi:MaoC family dehydratase N-terminal domain-containing protein [Paenibacillus sp. MWE-103]|uniref:MaoC family dehydratase N-terminal domain-containing protein n=1 Tax=Paenibacillus artemisiicola TaxID=1172618 RepID=A0ABS3W7S8_9BACL|nr:MaoC family dehydratase N-terminal domain-containing protein [Paenibacillus artemisiicola]MBO7744367.1 MaoC family dehydratase N-terminal domain-containing protein [Paenibacillus artemisiicola]